MIGAAMTWPSGITATFQPTTRALQPFEGEMLNADFLPRYRSVPGLPA